MDVCAYVCIFLWGGVYSLLFLTKLHSQRLSSFYSNTHSSTVILCILHNSLNPVSHSSALCKNILHNILTSTFLITMIVAFANNYKMQIISCYI